MSRHFCTYFDKNYLLRGLALHASLMEQAGDFVLWILCFDSYTEKALAKLNLPQTRLISLKDFEDKELLSVKKDRKFFEYYWTCTPSLPLYILKNNPEIKDICYLDSDLFFFNTPDKIYEQFIGKSILIIPHDFSGDREHRVTTSGKYNVCMIMFRNDSEGIKCLETWRKQCIEWCYARYENGKFGDQMYLNDWPSKFNNVCVLKHKGVNLGTWNMNKYSVTKKDGLFVVSDLPLIFYHFHALNMYLSNNNRIKFFPVNIHHGGIYKTYLDVLQKMFNLITNQGDKNHYGFSTKPSNIRLVKQTVLNLRNLIKK